jgi:hypothetical protein
MRAFQLGMLTSNMSKTLGLSNKVRSGYEIQLVQRTSASDNIMTTSAQFSVATLQAQGSPSKPNSMFPVVLAVPVVVVTIIIAASIWFCWFRKRRRQIQAQDRLRSRPQKLKHGSFVPLDPPKKALKTPVRDAKPDVEERSADGPIKKRKSTHEERQIARAPQRQLPVPPPPAVPIERTAELPIFITPRSSRYVFNHVQRLTPPAELDIHSVLPQVKSDDAAEVRARIQPNARRSKRLSLQQFLHIRKVAELEGSTGPASRSLESAQTEDGRVGQVLERQPPRPIRHSKRLSLQHLIHPRKVAELEGSSASPVQPSNSISSPDDESRDASNPRSQRLSLHRLIQSSKQEELEADTDVLPVYSHTDLDGKGHGSPPPLPPKDTNVKGKLSVPRWSRRTMSPVELDAAEIKRLSSPSSRRATSYKRYSRSSAGVAGSSSSSPSTAKNMDYLESIGQETDDTSQEVPFTLIKSPVRLNTKSSIPPTLDALEFLDLASTESEGGEEEEDGLDMVLDDAHTASNKAGTPLPIPVAEQTPVDPFLTAEIISAAVESYSGSSIAPKYKQAEEIDRGEEEAETKLPIIHEMDASDSAIKRLSKRLSYHAATLRNDTQRKRPDFTTFKKQMTEAERRAKMIAKRRKSRRRLTPKSF